MTLDEGGPLRSTQHYVYGCCCFGKADIDLFYGDEQFEHELARSMALRIQAEKPEQLGSKRGPSSDGPQFTERIGVDRIEGTGKIRGNSGYISPDAWPSTFDIGTLTSVKSAGHKRPRKMYPIKGSQPCDWAGLDNCGGGPVPILGCLNNPASEWHHGPDKNTLNNERVSAGIGNSQNLHVICSECHNAWHAANDAFYLRSSPDPKDSDAPYYDRDRDQASPFIPLPGVDWAGHAPVEADLEKLLEQERTRSQQQRDRGREHRGRQLKDEIPDFSITDEEEQDDE